MASFQENPVLEFYQGHKREQSQDSGAYIDWNSEDSSSPTGNSDGHVAGEFVTVVAVESSGKDEKKIQSSFITVLAIGEDRGEPVVEDAEDEKEEVGEEVLVYRLPGERLGFGLKFEGGMNTAENVKRLFIQSSAPDSPASRAECSWGALVEGDEILEIDGFAVKDMTRLDCVRCLKESSVVIKLYVRHSVGKSKDRMKKISFDYTPIAPGASPDVSAPLSVLPEVGQTDTKKRTPPPPPIPPRKIPRKIPIPSPKEKIAVVGPPEGFGDVECVYSPVPRARSIQSCPDDEHSRCHSKSSLRAPQKLKQDSPDASKRVVKRNSFKDCHHVPPEPEVYLDVLAQEETKNNCESESDDTGSTISTVVGFSSVPTTTNSSFSDLRSSASSVCDSTTPSTPTSAPTTPILDLSRILSPYENSDSDFLFTKLINDKDKDIVGYDEKASVSSNDVSTLQPPLSFQDAPLSYGNEEVRAVLTEEEEGYHDGEFFPSLKNYPEENFEEVDLSNDQRAITTTSHKSAPPNKKSSLIPRLAKTIGLLSPPKASPRRDVKDSNNASEAVGKSRSNKKRPPPPPPPRSDRPLCPQPEPSESRAVKSSISYLKKKKSKHEDEKKAGRVEKKAKSKMESKAAGDAAPRVTVDAVESEAKLCWPVPELKGHGSEMRLDLNNLESFDVCENNGSVADESEGPMPGDFLPDSASLEFGAEAIASRDPYYLFQWGGSKQLETIGEDEEDEAMEGHIGKKGGRIPEMTIEEVEEGVTEEPKEEASPDGGQIDAATDCRPNYDHVNHNDSATTATGNIEPEKCNGELKKVMVPIVPSAFVLAPPPSFSRMPPDGHEFPQNYQEAGEATPCKVREEAPPLPTTEPPPHKSLSRMDSGLDAALSKKHFCPDASSRVSLWRQDERSEKSVRDKIAMFSSVPNAPVTPTGSFCSGKLSKYKSSEDVFYDDEGDGGKCLAGGQLFSKSSLSVEKIGQTVHGGTGRRNGFLESPVTPRTLDYAARTQSSTDLSSSSSAYSSSCSPDSSLSSTTSSYLGYSSTLPRKNSRTDSTKNDAVSRWSGMSRATSFSGRGTDVVCSNNATRSKKETPAEAEQRKCSLHLLVEQRRKNMSKLRGLVIPEKLSDSTPSAIFDLPEIKSRDSILTCNFPQVQKEENRLSLGSQTKCGDCEPTARSVRSVHSSSDLTSPPWKVQSRSPNVPKYSPAFKRKSISVYGSSTGATSERVWAPSKPPRNIQSGKAENGNVADEKLRLTSEPGRSEDESDDSAVSSSRSSVSHGCSPPASPLLDKFPLTRTFSTETTTSNTSTLTSGSQSSCCSNNSDGDRRILKPQSVEAINRKNVLASAKYSRGFDVKSGSPLIQRKLLADSPDKDSTDGAPLVSNGCDPVELFVNGHGESNYSNGVVSTKSEPFVYRLADSFESCGSRVEVKVAFVNHVSHEDAHDGCEDSSRKRKFDITNSPPSGTPAPAPRRTSGPAAFGWNSEEEWSPPGRHSPLTSKVSSDSVRSRASSADTIVENVAGLGSSSGAGRNDDACDLSKREPLRYIKDVEVSSDKMSNGNRRSVSVNDIRKAFEKAECALSTTGRTTNSKAPAPVSSLQYGAYGNHVRVSSLDSTTSEDSCVLNAGPYGSSSNLHREQFGSITSLASSTSLISPQELQLLIDEANQTLEESGGSLGGSTAVSHDVLVVILHRDSAGGSVGITLAGGADYESKEITVHKVLAGSPADRDGRVQKGDRILSINGRSMKGATHRESLAILKSPRPEVVLVVSRIKSDQVTSVEVVPTEEPATTPMKSSVNGCGSRHPRIIEGTMLTDSVLAYSSVDDLARGPPISLLLVKDGAGLGFSLEGGKDSPLGDKPLVIKKIFTGGAADKSGQLRAGDELLNVNGIDVVPMSRIEAWKLMKRIPDGNVSITVRRLVENRIGSV